MSGDRGAPRVILGVGGGIAAYKVAELLRLLTESGHDVQVVPTAAALNFVGAPTWAALSGNPVRTDVFEDVHSVPHVRLGQRADLVLVAPATADLLAKAAAGLAGDLLGNILLTARCPVVFAPAMHTEMWEHQATRDNVATLRRRGAIVLEPASGRLTGSDTGPGRLPEAVEIFDTARALLTRPGAEPDLHGRTVVVSAGGTREPIDPVRFLGNRSSGRQGFALAAAAARRGAEVTLVAANTALSVPAGVRVVAVETAEQLRSAVLAAAGRADAVVMAAAVADFRPVAVAEHKVKKSSADPAPLQLERTGDVLAELVGQRRPGQVLVGFAAETPQADLGVEELGRAKLAAKGCDLLVVNEVGPDKVFDKPDTEAVILGADGTRIESGPGPKEALADLVWDAVVARWSGPTEQDPR
jgi:phosphopantothenoylcysteine decarboxylase/phosphopantothenate--cysteine ligase